MNKRMLSVLFLLILPLCAHADGLQVVTTIFPLYDWAREIGGDQTDAIQLLPPGVEAHGYAPRPSDILRLQHADVFIYLSEYMEPWAEDLAKGLDNPHLLSVKAAEGIDLEEAHTDHEDAQGHEYHHDRDPHVWLDPILAQKLVGKIADALSEKDPVHRNLYQGRATAYNEKLQALDQDIRDALAHCPRKEILYGGHFAFGYFARRYGLHHESPYQGFSPNATPSPRAVAELVQKMKAEGWTVVYHEELIDPKVARILAEETGAQLMVLHGAHNITSDEREQGVTYLSIMRDNIERLKAGLGYRSEGVVE